MASLASEVKVANLALVGLGADTIMALSEDSENARKVNVIFDLYRDEVLRAHLWNFALERVDFGAVLAASPVYEFENFFQIPGDVIRIVQPETKSIIFKIEGDRVATNEGEFKALCLKRITDATLWSVDFVTCFAARLEAELAYAIADNRALADQKLQIYIDKLKVARSTDSQEGTPLEYDPDEWLLSRSSGELGRDVPLAE